jgi:probable phosphoglycerate mutase
MAAERSRGREAVAKAEAESAWPERPDPEPTRIFLMRHGQTDWNVEQRVQGQLDVPLNATGRWQVAQLGLALAEEHFAAIYSSDLSRALATAQAVAQAGPGALEVRLDAGLRERSFGFLEGHTWSEIEQRWPEDSRRWRSREPDFGPGGGETLTGFQRRCVAALQRVASAHAGQSVAVVAHGGVLDALYRWAMGIPLPAPRTWQLGNAAINRLLWTSERLSVVGWSDNGHLQPVADR